MTTATYSHAENAQFLTELANNADLSQAQVERLHDLAAREAEQDPAYVAYVNEKVRAALANPGRMYTSDEMREKIKSW
ncbi:MAG: hypothetical protein LBE78_12020 [Burkholderiaceae bacterium]|jgi:hypothetical protein|nr:hypothetical protein [Burkholderiaceae bacterium]